MRAVYNALVAAAGISILAACTGGQSGIEPPSTRADVQHNSSLQFRVGTYRTSGGSVWLNTVETFRQQNGLSATLYNSPTITGPAGFVVPAAGAAGTDAGTNHISSTPPTQPGTPAVLTTFNQLGGAYAYGFAPANSNTSGAANYPNIKGIGNNSAAFGCNVCNANGFALFNEYTSPYYLGSGSRSVFLLGPPAVPDFHNGTFANGFLGYDSGFMSFAATPVAGVYNLHVDVPGPTIGVNVASFDAPATLTTVVPLPPLAGAPIITPTAGGGATFVVAPAPPGVTNQVLYVIDVNGSTGTPTFYTFNAGAAGGTFALSNTAGPTTATGVHQPPFTPANADNVYAYVVGADYDVLGGAPPNNTQQNPTLPAQTDVVISPIGVLSPYP